MAYNQVLVNNFGNSSLPDTQEAFQLGGKQGEGLVSEIHGKWYTAAYRGNVFHATSPIAGQVIPVITSTTSQTALSLYNPLGSGKNLELISFRLGQSITTATFVIGSIGFGVLQNVGNGVALPTSQVAATIFGTPFGANASSPQGKALSTCTTVAASTFLDIGLGVGLTTGEQAGVIEKLFDGSIILGPGSMLMTQGTVAQTSSYVLGMSWCEWPQ